MPRGLNNWTGTDVVKFLREYDFVHTHTRGSHFYYVWRDGDDAYQVTVPIHGKSAIKPRTMKSIVVQSGIPQEEWTGAKKKRTK